MIGDEIINEDAIGSHIDDMIGDEINSWCDSGSIYTSDALTVLAETRDGDQAALDEYGSTLFEGDSIAMIYSRIAYYAIENDIREELGDWQPEPAAESAAEA